MTSEWSHGVMSLWHHMVIIILRDHCVIKRLRFNDYLVFMYIWHQNEVTVLCQNDITWWSSSCEITVISKICHVLTIKVWCLYDIRMKSLCDVIMISHGDIHTMRSLWYQRIIMWWLSRRDVYVTSAWGSCVMS